MSSPSKVAKVNYLYIRHLRFRSVRGDLQEGYFALPDANFLFPWCQSPASRAQKWGFCAFLTFGTPVFGRFEHKKGIFVRFWPSEPPFSGFSSTKSPFLCSRGGESGIGKRNRGDAYHFAAAPTPSHQRTRTPAPAHQHQRTSPATAPQQWHQAPSSAVWCRVMPAGCRNGVVTVSSRSRYGTALD